MYRVILIIFFLFISLSGCSPVSQRPVELLSFSYQPTYAPVQLPVRWEILTSVPSAAKTSTVTMPVGASPVFIPMGGTDVPAPQLLTEQDQYQIVYMLKNAVGELPSSSCVATVRFDDLVYQFHEHQYWATVTLTISDGHREILQKKERFWSAEDMTLSQRWSTHPQIGKQALAKQILDKVGVFAVSSVNELSVCAP